MTLFRTLGLMLPLLLASTAVAAECTPLQIEQLQQQAQTASVNGDTRRQRANLSQLLHCQPHRGDLHIELLRLALQMNDLPRALQHREWLYQNNIPKSLALLVDSWIAAAQTQPDAQPKQADLRWRFTQGYDSNANDGSRHSDISINLGGLDLLWQLDNASTAKASHFTRLGVNWSYQENNRRWHLSAQHSYLHQLNEHETLIQASVEQPFACATALQCSIRLRLGGLQEEQGRQWHTQVGLGLQSEHIGGELYLQHTQESINSNSIGATLYATPQDNLLIFAGAEYNQPDDPRAGQPHQRPPRGTLQAIGFTAMDDRPHWAARIRTGSLLTAVFR